MTRTRDGRMRPGTFAIGLLLVAATGCETGTGTGGTTSHPGNVEVRFGAVVEATDTGVVVDGVPVLPHVWRGATVRIERFERFENGGFPEHDYAHAETHSLAWRVGLSHGEPPRASADSTIHRHVDHGDATLEGVAMDRLTEIHVPDGTPVRFESFISYLLSVYVHVEWQGGGATRFVEQPFAHALTDGSELRLATTGSAQAQPTEARFAAQPQATVIGLNSAGSNIALHGAVPVIDVRKSLTLVFDRPLDPAMSFLFAVPFRAFGTSATRAFLQPTSPAERVVIPAAVLSQLRGAGTGPLAFRLIIHQFSVQHDVFAGTLADASPFSLPLLQQSETSLNLYLTR